MINSTRRLLELCAGYFVFYVGTGIAVKYFTEVSQPPMSQLVYLFQNTAGSSLFVIIAIFFLGWHHLIRRMLLTKDAWPIALSGVCTAIVIPTTTLMYLLPISVMVAMVIMRGSVIVISRAVDAIQIRQGISKKKITKEENWAVVFALLAVAVNLLAPSHGGDRMAFLHNSTALTILGAYLAAYSIRLYVMNYFKNTARPGSERPDNRAYFTLEQCWATFVMILVTIGLFAFGLVPAQVMSPNPWAMASGIAYAGVAFFSVFIFMFPGRTATFAGVANRLTSLTAGTSSTLLMALFFGKSYPTLYEWGSLFWIGVATALLIRVETRAKSSKPLAPARRSSPERVR